ncbi:MAG: hypothetical protein IT462_16610 [Planctomycetes bacterium]|nr:hypothetical protein [Planctomycetota bacterium]
MTNVKVYSHCEHIKGDGRVRMAWLEADTHVVLAIADGSAVKAGTPLASQTAVEMAMKFAEGNTFPFDPARWVKCIQDIDAHIADNNRGETTLFILATDGELLAGAACGDTHARQFGPGGVLPVYARPTVKGLIGSKQAIVDPIQLAYTSPVIVAATKGLWRYTKVETVHQTVGATASSKLPSALAGLVRLKTGALNDDTGIFTMVKRKSGTKGPTDEMPVDDITEALPAE